MVADQSVINPHLGGADAARASGTDAKSGPEAMLLQAPTTSVRRSHWLNRRSLRVSGSVGGPGDVLQVSVCGATVSSGKVNPFQQWQPTFGVEGLNLTIDGQQSSKKRRSLQFSAPRIDGAKDFCLRRAKKCACQMQNKSGIALKPRANSAEYSALPSCPATVAEHPATHVQPCKLAFTKSRPV